MRLTHLAPVVLSWGALAYNAPTDTAGPLTVSMQSPAVGAYGAGGFADLSRPGVPFSLPVTLQNSSETEITGTLRVVVIDKWKVEPAGSIPFRVAGRGRTRREFTLSFAAGTLNAHYPIHVYAEFDHQGQKLTAHPVMIVQTHIPDLPRPRLPIEWKPIPVPSHGTLSLWRMPVRRESASLVNLGAEAGVAGRETFDAASIFVYTADGIAMTLGPRPPSRRESVESAAVEYPLAFPAVKPLRLTYKTSGAGTFAVKVAPFAGGAWTTLASPDLSAYGGSSIRLRLESQAASGDAVWTEPTIVAGEPLQPPNTPPKSLGTAGSCRVQLGPGARGLLDAPIEFLCNDRRLSFQGFRIKVDGELIDTRDESTAQKVKIRHKYAGWAGNFDVLGEIWVENDALRAHFARENAPPPRPWFQLYLEAVSAGPWSEKATRIYAGPGNVIENPQPFRLGFDGHNLATSFVGFDFANGQSIVQNSTAIPDRLEVDPAAGIYTLVTPHEQTLEFHPAQNVFAAVKRIREQDTRKPSKCVAKIAGRFTFDLWSGRYGESARALERAAEYGLTDALVVWHSWQRWGYDYRLPDIYPPNPQFGATEEFRQLVEACKRRNTLFAPHDNYVDFYPDFEGFTYDSIVFRQNGTPYKAWFNYGREAQSYRARPDRLLPYVQRNVGLLKDGMAPNAYFIDVWSSMAPYDYWTPDGKFVDRSVTQKVWGGVFAWIRDFLGSDAPQLSEAGHDKLIGWLDGADAQQLRLDPAGPSFTWKIQAADSERIPWIDVAWHDKFILHGAGYEGRYQGGLPAQEHGAFSDDYITTEVLSGRPAMVPQAFNRNVVRVHWLLNDAMKALALDVIDAVEFAGNNIHRQHVRWHNGAGVYVNRGAEPWIVEGHTLPQYGFYLRAGKVEAAIETRDGARVEWSRSPAQTYAEGKRTLPSGQVQSLP